METARDRQRRKAAAVQAAQTQSTTQKEAQQSGARDRQRAKAAQVAQQGVKRTKTNTKFAEAADRMERVGINTENERSMLDRKLEQNRAERAAAHAAPQKTLQQDAARVGAQAQRDFGKARETANGAYSDAMNRLLAQHDRDSEILKNLVTDDWERRHGGLSLESTKIARRLLNRGEIASNREIAASLLPTDWRNRSKTITVEDAERKKMIQDAAGIADDSAQAIRTMLGGDAQAIVQQENARRGANQLAILNAMNDMAPGSGTRYFAEAPSHEGTNAADVVPYLLGMTAAGTAGAVGNIMKGAGVTVGDALTGGKTSNEYRTLSEYLQETPEMERLVMRTNGQGAEGDVVVATISRATGIPEAHVRSYLQATEADRWTQQVENTNRISPALRESAGQWAYSIGQQLPGIVLTAGAGAAGQALSKAVTLGLMGAQSYGGKLAENAKKYGFTVGGYANALVTAAIETGTELIDDFVPTAGAILSIAAPTELGKNMLGEGFEEAIGYPLEQLADWLLLPHGEDTLRDIFDMKEWIGSFASGAIVGGMMGSAGAMLNLAGRVMDGGISLQEAARKANEIASTLPGQYRPTLLNEWYGVSEADVQKFLGETAQAMQRYAEDMRAEAKQHPENMADGAQEAASDAQSGVDGAVNETAPGNGNGAQNAAQRATENTARQEDARQTQQEAQSGEESTRNETTRTAENAAQNEVQSTTRNAQQESTGPEGRSPTASGETMQDARARQRAKAKEIQRAKDQAAKRNAGELTPEQQAARAREAEIGTEAEQQTRLQAEMDRLGRELRAGEITEEEYNNLMDDLLDANGEEIGGTLTTEENADTLEEPQIAANPEAWPTEQNIRRREAENHGGRVSDTAGGERAAGTRAEEQTEGVAGGAGEAEGSGIQSKAAGRNPSVYRKIQSEKVRPVSARELGISIGSKTQNVHILPEESWDAELQELAREVRAAGHDVTFVTDRMEVWNAHTNRMQKVPAANIYGNIIVNAAETRDTARQLVEHELYHSKADGDRGLVVRTWEALTEQYGEAEMNRMLSETVEDYQGIYGREADDMIRYQEEALADLYAGRNRRARRGGTLDEMQKTVRQEAAGAKTVAPDGERFLIAGTLDSDLQDVLDNQFRANGNEVYIGETSNFLTDVIGADALSVTMPASKAYSAMVTEEEAARQGRFQEGVNYHGLGKDGLLRALVASENPVAAFAATGDEKSKRTDRIVLVTDEASKEGQLVVVETFDTEGRRNGKRIDANKVITSYGRTALQSDILQAAAEGRLLFLDKKRSQDILAGVPASNSPGAIREADFKNNIRNFWANVNWKKSGRENFLSGAAEQETELARAYREAQEKKKRRAARSGENFAMAGANARTADLDALRRAKELAAEDVSADTILQETGWYQGRDGKWRFEIDDSGMEYRRDGDANLMQEEGYRRLQELTEKFDNLTEAEQAEYDRLAAEYEERVYEEKFELGDFLKHDALFEAYPSLRHVTLRFDELDPGVKGRFNKQDNTLTLSRDLIGAPEKTLLHEIQHAIQKAEGFTGGASPEYWARTDYENGTSSTERLQERYDSILNAQSREDQNKFIRYQELERAMEPLFLSDENTEDGQRYLRYEAQQDALYEELYPNEWFRDLLDLDRRMGNPQEEYMNLYRNTAGEIEARDVAARKDLTAEERRNRMPELGDENTVFADSGEGYELTKPLAQTDSTGRTLSAGQQEFFRDSKAVDGEGRLLTLYHGTGAKFTVFDKGRIEQNFQNRGGDLGFYFSPYFEDARGYAREAAFSTGGEKTVMEVYLNLKNPLVVEDEGWGSAISQADIRHGDLKRWAQEGGHDGIIVKSTDEVDDDGTPDAVYIAFSPEQIKNVTNENPTENPDVRFSMPAEPQIAENPEAWPTEENRQNAQQTETQQEAEEKRTPFEQLNTRAKEYTERAERVFAREIAQALSLPGSVKKEFLQNAVREMTNEYLESGKLGQKRLDEMFDRMYNEGIVIDREYYDTYKEVRDFLKSTPMHVDEAWRPREWNDFKKRAFGSLRLANEGRGVDSVYAEVQAMAPGLFPESIIAPEDQLMRMYEVSSDIRIAKKSLDEAAGADAAEFRKWAKNEWNAAAANAMEKLNRVIRYRDQPTQGQTTYTAETIRPVYDQVKIARREMEKAKALALLTNQEIAQAAAVAKGTFSAKDLRGPNAGAVAKVADAMRSYEELVQRIRDYNAQRRQTLRDEADEFLKDAASWKDKKTGLQYSTETLERNIRDIVTDKDTADKMVRRYVTEYKNHEAARNRDMTRLRNQVREMNLSREIKTGDVVSEAHAVQLYGEAEDAIRMLERSGGRMDKREGKTLEDWRGIIQNLWMENPGLDQNKIRSAVQEFRSIYDELLKRMNDARVENGYEPISYRSGYFPHFQPGEGDGILRQFAKNMGMSMDVTSLPTSINGLTKTFKPGIRWIAAAQERLGYSTVYDAVEGFDKYLEGVSDVIYHTGDIQAQRALANQIRYRTTDEGIQKQIDEIRNNPELSEDERQDMLEAFYADNSKRFQLSHFVVDLEEHINTIANKRSSEDRAMEEKLGRNIYNLMKSVEGRVAANMVAINPGSWLTNFIPLSQAWATTSGKNILRGMWDTLKNIKKNDGFADVSNFLTNRRGSEQLVKSYEQTTNASPAAQTAKRLSGIWSEKLGKPMDVIDSFTSEAIVRARYRQNLERKMSEALAMEEADSWAADIMADRSKGATPNIFNARNPLTKAFTQFQLEVNNELRWIAKDLPRMAGGDKKKLAAMIAKFLLGAWLYNQVYEFIVGRKAALDPIGIVNDSVGDFTGYQLPNVFELGIDAVQGDASLKTNRETLPDAIGNLGGNLADELPFLGGLLGGGRIPISSALPDAGNLINAATNSNWSAKKRLATAGKELGGSIGTYLLPPFGGGAVKKLWQTTKGLIQGGVYGMDAEGNDQLKYPLYMDSPWDAAETIIRGTLFGPTTTETGREWMQNGFGYQSAKKTGVYKDMRREVGDREAWQTLQGMKDAGSGAQQREALQNLDADERAKAIYYYGMMATDAGREQMDALTDAGEDAWTAAKYLMDRADAEGSRAKREALLDSGLTGKGKLLAYAADLDEDSKELQYIMGLDKSAPAEGIVQTLCAIKDANSAEDKSQAKRDAVRTSGLSDADALDLYTSIISSNEDRNESMRVMQRQGMSIGQILDAADKYAQLSKESGSAAQKATAFSAWVDRQKIPAAAKDTVKDAYGFYSQMRQDAERYESFRAAGLTADESEKLDTALRNLKPESGKTTVSELQRLEAVTKQGLSTEKQTAAFRELMGEDSYAKFQQAQSYGVTPKIWVQWKTEQQQADADGNGSLNQTEAESAIRKMFGLLPSPDELAMQAALWQLTNKSWKSKNNPFDKTIGQEVYERLHAD